MVGDQGERFKYLIPLMVSLSNQLDCPSEFEREDFRPFGKLRATWWALRATYYRIRATCCRLIVGQDPDILAAAALA